MLKRPLFVVTVTLPLLLAVGCGGSGSDSASREVSLQVVGAFEKQTLTPSGLSAVVVLPARHCYAEVRQDSNDAILASGYLGADGTGTATVSAGTRVYVTLYPTFYLPTSNGTSSVMHGGVKRAAVSGSYANTAAFNALPDWFVNSSAVTVNDSGTLSVRALNSTLNREAGAFNIADQALTFAQTIQAVEPGLTLPNLHLFWQPEGQATTSFPSAAVDLTGRVLQQSSTRAIFQMAVRGRAVSSPLAGVDEFNDGLLQQHFASLLFAPYSYPADGSAASSIIRGDNDAFGRTDRGIQGESTATFITGFCDFFSAAVRNTPTISEVDDAGAISTFNLDSHSHAARTPNQGEFYSDAVAVSLYGTWKRNLNGTTAGLQTLWDATLAQTPGAYLNAPLACYPTYLVGLKDKLSTAAWTATLGELALEDMGDLTAASYFGDPSVAGVTPLWVTVARPFTVSGSLVTHAAASNIWYDRNQAEAYRFVQAAAGPLTVTMTPLDGQDFFVELIGPSGVVLGSYDQRATPGARTLTTTNLTGGVLAPGTYVVRVKAGYTTAALSAARYTLSVS